MTDVSTVGPDHLRRAAVVYIRQSSLAQVENNSESTRRQYALVEKAHQLGWPRAAVAVVDEDLGLSGAGTAGRSGFAHMASEVAMGRVGIVLCLEVSRLARNNADWYRLLDLCALTRTLIADTDGLYHPGDFNDRLVLGLKGTMSEAELHILRARLDGGIRHKAALGELRRGLPSRWAARYAGSCRPTTPSTASSSIPATPAPIPMAGPGRSVILTARAGCAAACAGCPRGNGRC